MSHRALASCLASFVLSLPLCFAGPATWTPILEDQFDREMIGPDWHVLRGDWRIEQGSLRVTRVWPSDNNLMCPHRIHMRRGRLEQDQKQAQGRLDYVTKLLQSVTQRGQTLQKQIAELKKKPDANAAKLKQLDGQRQRHESDAQNQTKACEVWGAKLAVPTLWLQMMDQETTVRIAKFAQMKARWDRAPAPQIRQAETAAKKAEDELARLRSALKQAQERVAEMEKNK